MVSSKTASNGLESYAFWRSSTIVTLFREIGNNNLTMEGAFALGQMISLQDLTLTNVFEQEDSLSKTNPPAIEIARQCASSLLRCNCLFKLTAGNRCWKIVWFTNDDELLWRLSRHPMLQKLLLLGIDKIIGDKQEIGG